MGFGLAVVVRARNAGFALLAMTMLVGASDREAAVRAGFAQDVRLATIGYRLARTCVGWAGAERHITLPGLLVQDIAQFASADRDAARRLLKIGDAPTVVAVLPGSAAERARLLPGDQLLRVDGQPIDASVTRSPYARIAQLETLSTMFKGARPITLSVRRGDGRLFETTIEREAGCASVFQIVAGGLRNTQADGRYVQISQAMVDLAQSDDELATVTAHELAHNVFAGMGLRFASSKEEELEADRFGVQLMARAGYNPKAVVRFWMRVRAKSDYGIFADGSHPSWSKRLAALAAAVTAVEADRAKGRAPFPLTQEPASHR